jgi:hypothetical protein
MKAATRKRSRLLSPAGFALVLLLFLFMPFLSAACEVAGGGGSVGADYRGTHLVSGAEPGIEIPPDLEDLVTDLVRATPADTPAPDPGVQLLAIIVSLVLVAGIALPFVPRLAHQVRLRMFGGAALAVGAGVLMIVTQLAAQTEVASQLVGYARDLGVSNEETTTDVFAEQLVHTGVGFWLALLLLFVIAVVSVGYVYRDKIFPGSGHTTETVGSAVPIWQADIPEPAVEHDDHLEHAEPVPAEPTEPAEPPPAERAD